MKIIKKFGDWAVTDLGVDHIGDPSYEIDKECLLTVDWVNHMKVKRWVNINNFTRAFNFALKYHCNVKEAA